MFDDMYVCVVLHVCMSDCVLAAGVRTTCKYNELKMKKKVRRLAWLQAVKTVIGFCLMFVTPRV